MSVTPPTLVHDGRADESPGSAIAAGAEIKAAAAPAATISGVKRLVLRIGKPFFWKSPSYPPAYSPFPVIRGKSNVVEIPGSASMTAGIALTTRAAVATSPAWL